MVTVLTGKPANVTEFYGCHENVRDFRKKTRKCWGKILSAKNAQELFKKLHQNWLLVSFT